MRFRFDARPRTAEPSWHIDAQDAGGFWTVGALDGERFDALFS